MSRADENAAGGDEGEIGVLVVDDAESFRGAVREVLDTMAGWVLRGEAASGEEAIHAVESLSPQLVLMDVRMPGMGGIQATEAICRRYPSTVVVLMSADDVQPLPRSPQPCGAAALLRKQELGPRRLRELFTQTRPPAA